MRRLFLALLAWVALAGAAFAETELPPAAAQAFRALGNGATGITDLAHRFGHRYNVADDGKALGDGLIEFSNTSCTAGGYFLTVSTSSKGPLVPFTAADVTPGNPKAIVVPGCGNHYMFGGAITVKTAGSNYVFGEKLACPIGGVIDHACEIVVLKTDAADGASAGGIVLAAFDDGGDYTSSFPTGDLSQSGTNGQGFGAVFNFPTPQNVYLGHITSVSDATHITVNPAFTETMAAQPNRIAWGHDDTSAFVGGVNALSSLIAAGGLLDVPPPPNGHCYMILGQVAFPSDGTELHSIRMQGVGQQSQLCVGAVTAGLTMSAGFSYGHEIDSIKVDGLQIATHDLAITRGGQWRITNNWMVNSAAGGSNVYLAPTANGGYLHGNHILNKWQVYANLNQLPAWPLHNESIDTKFTDNQYFNGATAYVYENAPDASHTGDHPFGYGPGATASAYLAPNVVIVHNSSRWENSTFDTATVAGLWVTGYGAQILGNHCISLDPAAPGVSGVVNMPECIHLNAGVQSVIVAHNWADSHTDKVVGWDGPPGNNTCVTDNVGGATLSVVANARCKPLISGYGSANIAQPFGPEILGVLGDFGECRGNGDFCEGDGTFSDFRWGCHVHAAGFTAVAGEAQISDCVFRGAASNGSPFNVLAFGTAAPTANNIAHIRLDKKTLMRFTVALTAFCSSGDYGGWSAAGAIVQTTGNASDVHWAGATPTFTVDPVVGRSAGAISGAWSPSLTLDTTNGGVYPVMAGACAGSKTIYVTADVHLTEALSGAN